MEGKVALITGGASGIGKAIAVALLDKGAKVCICDVNEINGSKTEDELAARYPSKIFFRKCDVTSTQELEGCFHETIQRYGGLDILCNNAGVLSESNWQRMVDTNLTAVIDGTILGLKYMKREPGKHSGIILNTSSIAGLVPIDVFPVYCAVKSGIIGFTRSLGGISPKYHGVRVNCFCPAAVDTSFSVLRPDQVFEANEELLEATRQAWIQPGIVLDTKEVAVSVMKLIEDESLSGEVLLISRGPNGIVKLPAHLEELVTRD